MTGTFTCVVENEGWGDSVYHFGDGLENVRPIGGGGYGSVFRAQQPRLGRSVIVKVLDSPALGGHGRALVEARAQAAVCWHANILTVFREGVTESGWPYLLLEDASGGSLAERVAATGPLDPAAALEMGAQLAGALCAAAACGVVHCDVKPSNVLFARDGSVRLADFGAASTSGTHTLDLVQGSLLFAPPELLEGRHPTTANDVYGLGVTMYFALVGHSPFGDAEQPVATTMARIHGQDVQFGDTGLPQEVSGLLDATLSKDPDQRPSIEYLALHLSDGCSRAEPDQAVADPPVAEVERVVRGVLANRRAVVDRLLGVLHSDIGAVDLARTLVEDFAEESADSVMPLINLVSRSRRVPNGRS